MNSHLPPSLAVGAALLRGVVCCFVCACVQLLCGASVTWLAAAVALAATFLPAVAARRREVTLALAAIIGAAALVCRFTFDGWYDSLTYHKATAIALHQGWNPVADFLQGRENSDVIVWSVHYARFCETVAAAVLSLTNWLEMGRITSLLIPLSSLLIADAALQTRFAETLGSRARRLVALTLVMNPVVVDQMFSFKNDFILYCGVINLLSAVALLRDASRRRCAYEIIALTLVMMANSKFTHLCFGVLFAVGMVAYLHRRKSPLTSQVAIVSGVALVVGVAVLGFQPYLTNLIAHGDPFYPLLCGERDIMTGNTPELYLQHGRLWNLLHSLFSTSLAPLQHPLPTSAAQTGAYGPIFLYLTLASALLLAISRANLRLWLLWLAALASPLIFAQGWWARYVPFPWLCIGIAALAALLRPRAALRRMAYALIIPALATAAITMAYPLATSAYKYRQLNLIAADARRCGHVYVAIDSIFRPTLTYELRQRRIPYVLQDTIAQPTIRIGTVLTASPPPRPKASPRPSPERKGG
jgi:hypothetical protein